LRHLVSILSSMYWTAAAELGDASNGFTLTRGVFQQQIQVEYATGLSLLSAFQSQCTTFLCKRFDKNSLSSNYYSSESWAWVRVVS